MVNTGWSESMESDGLRRRGVIAQPLRSYSWFFLLSLWDQMVHRKCWLANGQHWLKWKHGIWRFVGEEVWSLSLCASGHSNQSAACTMLQIQPKRKSFIKLGKISNYIQQVGLICKALTKKYQRSTCINKPEASGFEEYKSFDLLMRCPCMWYTNCASSRHSSEHLPFEDLHCNFEGDWAGLLAVDRSGGWRRGWYWQAGNIYSSQLCQISFSNFLQADEIIWSKCRPRIKVLAGRQPLLIKIVPTRSDHLMTVLPTRECGISCKKIDPFFTKHQSTFGMSFTNEPLDCCGGNPILMLIWCLCLG